jgi:hypothetical protein
MVDPRFSKRLLEWLGHFSTALGWHGIQRFHHRFDPPDETTVVWYLAGLTGEGRTYCALQINEYPIGSSDSFAAAAHLMRYGICSGFHRFDCGNLVQLKSEAARLHSWLAREWFESLEGRRAYRLKHPECAGYSWKKLRSAGEPHYPGSGRRAR